MCGIAGIVNGDIHLMQKMLARQHSRGPDNTGIETIGNVIFGHNRLSIIDKSEESNQPVKNGGLLIYNGEIYNYNHAWKSDTLWINFELWDPYKDKYEDKYTSLFLNQLNGMFALGYFDGDKIYLCRDRFGIKPLYYTKQKSLFAFASTPAALSLVKNNWELSHEGLREYLSLGATMNHSMFSGIEAVPPGHYLVYDIHTEEIRIKQWYYPKFIENAKKEIKDRVYAAIDRVKLTCDEPQIILLSGGIDSTLVASRYKGQKAIHLHSPERQYAVDVASKFNIDLIDASPANESAEEGLNDFIFKSGDPTMAGLIPWITCREIAKHRFRVAITANGADELFFGYNRMSDGSQIESIFRPFMPFHWIKNESPQALEIKSYLQFDLNKTLDFASMCHSIEVRVPYLDHELVECALSLPKNEHTGHFGNKTILKEMLRDLGFGFDFIHRGKVGFSMHLSPSDEPELDQRAMKWYKSTGFPQLPLTATPRQEVYHIKTIRGLYLFMRLFGFT